MADLGVPVTDGYRLINGAVWQKLQMRECTRCSTVVIDPDVHDPVCPAGPRTVAAADASPAAKVDPAQARRLADLNEWLEEAVQGDGARRVWRSTACRRFEVERLEDLTVGQIETLRMELEGALGRRYEDGKPAPRPEVPDGS